MTKKMAPFIAFLSVVMSAGLIFTGCQSSHEVEVKPVEIKPIHITIDVNVRVDKALDDIFEDIEAAEDQNK